MNMNWSKAKTIMIVTFIFLNLLLYAVVVKTHEPQMSKLSSKDFAAIERVLEENNIFLSISLPEKAPPMPLVKVKREVFDDKFVLDHFIKSKDYRKYENSGETVFEFDSTTIKIGHFSFFFQEKSDKFLNMTSSDKERYIEDFLKQHLLKEKDGQIVKIERKSKGVTIEYRQFYNGYFVDDSFIKADISGDEFTVYKKWFESVIPEKDKKEIVDAIFAVLKLVEIKPEKAVVKIEDVKLGYYFNWPNASKGEAVPVWKIVSNEGIYYINAYTGNLERGE